MKSEVKANGNGEKHRIEKRANDNRVAGNRGSETDVRPELGVLGWAERARRLFGINLHA
jgi:hypothetical protein